MAWSIRKGCMHCRMPLTSWKEKVLRTCKNCASGAREAFEKMGSGKFKEGKEDLIDVMAGKEAIDKDKASQAIDITARAALSKRQNKIRSRLKKKGLTEEEIEQGLKEIGKGVNNV